MQDLQRLSCKIRLFCKYIYIFQYFVGMYNALQIRTFTWSGTCKVSKIRISKPFFNTNSALLGGVFRPKKSKKPKNLGKILKMVPSESPKKAYLNLQKNSLKVHFFIYLRPSEKHFICFKISCNPNANL